jgi:hypothetical protein
MKWIDLSTPEWEEEMSSTELKNRSIESNCVSFGSGQSLSSAAFSISKCPGNLITINWLDFTSSGITKLDKLIAELEPFYRKSDESLNPIYAFKTESSIYEFRVSRTNSFEIVVARKIKRNE